MFSSRVWTVLVGLVSLWRVVHAEVTLFVPGFDQQPLSASELSVDETGRTAWQIVAGQATDGVQATFTGTATLVQGPTDVRIMFENDQSSTVEISCDIQRTDLAFCTGERGFTATPVNLGAATPLTLQGSALTTSSTDSPATPTSSASASPAAAPTSIVPTAGTSAIDDSNAPAVSVTAPPSSATVVPALASATALSSLFNPGAGPAAAAANNAVCSRPVLAWPLLALAVICLLSALTP